MKLTLRHFFWIALLLFEFNAGCRGWAEESPQILFLHLKLNGDAISLLESTVKPGRLKTPVRSTKLGDLHLEIIGADGATLWDSTMPDPSVRRLDYADPEHPGRLKSKIVRTGDVEFNVRVPFYPQARKLTLQRLSEPAIPSDAPTNQKKLLGIIELPLARSSK